MVFKVGVNCQAIRNILQNSKLVFPHFNESFWACCRVYGSDKCHVFNIKIAAYFPPRPNKQQSGFSDYYRISNSNAMGISLNCNVLLSKRCSMLRWLLQNNYQTFVHISDRDRLRHFFRWSEQQAATMTNHHHQPATSVSSLPELMPITALRSSVVVVVAVAVILLRGLEIIINVVNI